MAASTYTRKIESEEDLEESLVDLLGTVTFTTVEGATAYEVEEAGEALIGLFADCTVNTYEDSGVLTNNRGIVLRTRDGQEFQLTIHRSK